jgi:hypothetical protein
MIIKININNLSLLEYKNIKIRYYIVKCMFNYVYHIHEYATDYLIYNHILL